MQIRVVVAQRQAKIIRHGIAVFAVNFFLGKSAAGNKKEGNTRYERLIKSPVQFFCFCNAGCLKQSIDLKRNEAEWCLLFVLTVFGRVYFAPATDAKGANNYKAAYLRNPMRPRLFHFRCAASASIRFSMAS